MAKVLVCDICKSEKGILVETCSYRSIKGFSELRLDVCKECNKTIPKDMVSYIKLVYKTLNPGAKEMPEEDIKRLYGSRIKL